MAKATPDVALRAAPELQPPDVFRLLVDSVTDYAIFMLDPAGLICTWNSGAERMKGYPAKEIIGKHFSVFYTAPDLALDKPNYELKLAMQDGRFEDEGWRVRKDGSRFWANVVITRICDKQGRHLGFGKITRDLSERRQSELRYRLLIEGVIDYAIFSMDPTGRITSWNVGAERLKGYKAEEIIGTHFSNFYTPEDRASELPRRVLEKAAANGHFEGEGWRVRKDGTRFWASVVVTALRDEAGNLYGFSKVTRDNTERKKLMDELQRHSEELELQVREREESNAELESFAYSVSHDLRAPLRAIAGFAQALQEDCAAGLDETGRDYLHEITSATARMNALVQDLLDYGRVSRINMPLEPVKLADVVAEAIRQAQQGDDGMLQVDVPSDICIYAQSQVLTQVLLNLLSNAFKFQRKGVKPEVRISAEVKERRVRLSVSDNGIGIAPQHQERIWQVFERLHDRDAFPGTGIGLAIVRRAVTRMHGSCGVESQINKGSTFWIEFPVASEGSLEAKN